MSYVHHRPPFRAMVHKRLIVLFFQGEGGTGELLSPCDRRSLSKR